MKWKDLSKEEKKSKRNKAFIIVGLIVSILGAFVEKSLLLNAGGLLFLVGFFSYSRQYAIKRRQKRLAEK